LVDPTLRLMMTRALVHLVGTAFAFGSVILLVPHGAMWLRMTAYSVAWLLCAALYFGWLYLYQTTVDHFEHRIRVIVRDELVVEDLRRYQRRLRFIARFQQAKPPRRPD